MPLFGSKHNKNKDNTAIGTTEATTGGGRHQLASDNSASNYPSAATGTGMGPGSNMPTGQQSQGMGSQGMGSQGMTGQQGGGGGGNNPSQGQYGQGQGQGYGQGFDNDNNYGTGGLDHSSATGVGAAGPGGAGIPSSNMLNHSGNATGGVGTRLTGKVESAIGTMVGSSALKAKGLQKEQETNAIKLQERELAEAERLEREAMMRRERAVGHGAHPANSQLGAGHVYGGNGGGGGTGPGGGSGAY